MLDMLSYDDLPQDKKTIGFIRGTFMICKVCGSEFDEKRFDVCPYCMSLASQKDGKKASIVVPNEHEYKMEMDRKGNDKERFSQVSHNDHNRIENEEMLKHQESQSDSTDVISIEDLGLSNRAYNALSLVGIRTVRELLDYLSEHDVYTLRNVGKKTADEITDIVAKLDSTSYKKAVKTKREELDAFTFSKMSFDIATIGIDGLETLGFSKLIVAKLKNSGIQSFGDLQSLSNRQIKSVLGQQNLERIQILYPLLEKDTETLITTVLDETRDSREFKFVKRRANGETLQEIADSSNPDGISLTRERVRQIESRYIKKMAPLVKNLIDKKQGGDPFVNVQDIISIFNDDDYNQIIIYIARSLEEYEYLDFTGMLVANNSSNSIEQTLLQSVEELVGDGIDLSECREAIDEMLIENRFDYLDYKSVVNLLHKYDYHFAGSFVVRRKNDYATVAMHIIRKYFPDGIKFSQSSVEESEDLIKLRSIALEQYGVVVPSDAHVVSAALVRRNLVLRDRGKYIPQESVCIDEPLFEDIINYITKAESKHIFYRELYAAFESALNVRCGIDNAYYLHGVLSMRFPDTYDYRKDYLIKKNDSKAKELSISDRIYSFICTTGRPVSKKELVQKFLGLSDIMLAMPFMNDKRLLQWDYNWYSCMGILEVTDTDRLIIRKCIMDLFEVNNCCISDVLLYETLGRDYPIFLKKNKIESRMNLFFLATKLFSDEFDFRRPTICEKGLISDISIKNVAYYLMGNPDSFIYDDYMKIGKKMRWTTMTISSALADMESDYVRISRDEYLRKSLFNISFETLMLVKEKVHRAITDDFAMLTDFGFQQFPKCDYQWNEFLLETVVKHYFDEYRIVHPAVTDRRYQKGIVVTKKSGLKSYSQVVANLMKTTGNTVMTTSQFLSFLVVNNLAIKVIPTELENSDYVKKEGDNFVVVS